jgi:hypothetical protein
VQEQRQTTVAGVLVRRGGRTCVSKWSGARCVFDGRDPGTRMAESITMERAIGQDAGPGRANEFERKYERNANS